MNKKMLSSALTVLGILLSTQLPLLAAPVLTQLNPTANGLELSANESLGYRVLKQDAKQVVVLLPGAKLGSLSPQYTANVGQVNLAENAQGVQMTVDFANNGLAYVFRMNKQNSALVLESIKPAEAIAKSLNNPSLSVQPVSSPSSNAGPRVNLKVRDGEVRDALTLLSRVSKTSIVTNQEVKGKVTLNLENTTFDEALKSLTSAAGLRTEKVGNVFVVSQPASQQPNASGGGGNSPNPLRSLNPKEFQGDPGRRLVSVIANSTPLNVALQEMANQVGVDIVINGELTEPVTARLVSRPFEDALKQLLLGTNFGFIRDGDTYRVGDATPGSPAARNFDDVQVIKLAYSDAKDVLAALPPDTRAQGIKVDAARNALIVSGPSNFQASIKRFVQTVDTPIQQVSFSVKAFQLDEGGSREFDVLKGADPSLGAIATANATNPISLAGAIAGTNVAMYNNIALSLSIINGLINENKGRVLTDTKLTTMSGQKASIDVSQDINVRITTPINTGGTSTISSQFQTIRAGNVIEIEPVIRADGKVFASISVEASVPVRKTILPDVAPDINRRKVTNKLILEDGQTLEIGGLIQETITETKRRLPLFGYLPLVGEFFSDTGEDKTTNQLLVFITPYLSRAPQASVPTLDPAPKRPSAPGISLPSQSGVR
ncbi:MAG: secretin N-terminal domain-containing protein [Gloeobacterales cyanobacterium]